MHSTIRMDTKSIFNRKNFVDILDFNAIVNQEEFKMKFKIS